MMVDWDSTWQDDWKGNGIKNSRIILVSICLFVRKQGSKLESMQGFWNVGQKKKKKMGKEAAVGMNGEVGLMWVTQMWPFSSHSLADDRLQVWGNGLLGYKKPSITISVIISSWPRPHSNQVINTHIILLKEIEKCIPDCQRKEFPMIYAEMFLELFFFFSSSIFKKY